MSYEQLFDKYKSMHTRNTDIEQQLYAMLNEMEVKLPLFIRDQGHYCDYNHVIEKRSVLNDLINTRSSLRFKKSICPQMFQDKKFGIKINNKQFLIPFYCNPSLPLSEIEVNAYLNKWNKECRSTELTLDEFTKYATEQLCSEWCKMDEAGEPFGGPYWKADVNSEEYINAYNLTLTRNIYFLYLLPFPKKLVLEACNILCSTRMESVLYVYFFMFLRHIQAMKFHGRTNLDTYVQPTTPPLNN